MQTRTENEIELLRVLKSMPELKLWLSDGELRYRAPKGLVTGSILELIRANKPAIINMLRESANGHGGKAQKPEFRRRQSAKRIRMRFHDGYWKRRHLFSVDYTNGPMIMRVVHLSINWSAIGSLITFIKERHDLLRGRFHDVGGEPVLVEDPEYAVPVYIRGKRVPLIEQWPGCTVKFDHEADEEPLREWASSKAWRPLDPYDEPWRVLISAIDDKSFFIGFVFHHFICDFYALPAIGDEIEFAYSTILRGEDLSNVKASLNYNDYMTAMAEFLDSAAGLRNVAYWERKLKGAPGTCLPNDRSIPSDDLGDDRVTLFYPAEKFVQVSQKCAEMNCTPAMALLAAQFSVLKKHSGANDLTIWNIREGRTDAALIDLFGNLVDEVPYRVLLPDSFSATELLQIVRDAVLEAEDHLPCPSVLTREIMSKGLANPEAPNFNFAPPGRSNQRHTSGEIKPAIWSPITLDAPPQTTRISRDHIYPYSVRANVVEGHLVGQLIYAEHRYTKETIDRFVSNIYEALDEFALW